MNIRGFILVIVQYVNGVPHIADVAPGHFADAEVCSQFAQAFLKELPKEEGTKRIGLCVPLPKLEDAPKPEHKDGDIET
jgi:hypothetical protein